MGFTITVGHSLLRKPVGCFMITMFLSLSVLEVSSQTYDQLKTQLQFENYYGTRLRSNNQSGEVSGSECLIGDWLPIEVVLANGAVTFDKGKLNLVSASADVIYKEREMYISPEHFKQIKLLNQNRIFVPGTKYYYKDVSLKGLLEVFDPSLAPPFIMEQHYVYLKEPNSNGYINAGLLEKKLVKATNIFLHDGVRLIPIKGRKDLEKYYSNNKPLFTKTRKELNTDFKDSKSLHRLVTSMQSAIKTN